MYATAYSPALPAAHKYPSFVSVNQVRTSLHALCLIAISEQQGNTCVSCGEGVCVRERERQAVWVSGHVLNAGYITHALQPGLVSYVDLMAFAHHAVMHLS